MVDDASNTQSDGEEDSASYLAAERTESPPVRYLSKFMGAMVSIIAVTWAIDFWLERGFEWYDEQAMIACLGLTLGIIFLRVPANSHVQTRLAVPWYDAILSVLGFGSCAYFVYHYDAILNEAFATREQAFWIGIIVIPLVWEALRRTAGWSLTIIFTVFVAYSFVGHLVPGMLRGVGPQGVTILTFVKTNIAFLSTDTVALVGLPLKIIVLTVVLFIWMGQLLLFSGASGWFTDLAAALMGRSRGGSAKIAVVASSLFGSISGSAVSNVVSTGVITIPLMRQAGYDPKTAGAIESVASTGGQIMPPIMGAVAFLMAEILELAYTEIILAALIPAALYYLAVFVQVDLLAGKNKIARMPEERIPNFLKVMKEGWFFILPFAVLIVALFSLNLPPQEAAFWAAITVVFVSVVFGYKGKRITPKQFWDSLAGGGRVSADIIVIGAMAGIIIGLLDKTGLGQSLTLILATVGESNLFLLLVLTAFVSIMLGMGMPTSAVYLLLATMIAPSLIELEVNAIAAHMFLLYYGLMSMITPPVAIAAFAAASLAGAKPMETGFTAVRLGWIAYIIPFVFVLSPALLMQGEAFEVASAAVTAVLGVWIGSCGLIGFLYRPLGPTSRALFIVSGVGLLLPAHAVPAGVWFNVLGAILAVLVIGREMAVRRAAGVPAE